MKTGFKNKISSNVGIILILALTILIQPLNLYSQNNDNDHSDYGDMVYISGGTFMMGYELGQVDELPLHEVALEPFLLDRHEVTNREFSRFVEATGYITRAENDGYCWAFLKGSNNFQKAAGANWRHPQGPDSKLEGRLDHPVVCVSWHDAAAYAAWAGKRLPTEAEWEYAARAGAEIHSIANTDSENNLLQPISTTINDREIVAANVWQGSWPEDNRLSDGFYYTSPVGQFNPNDFGLHDMIGNVWEWTSDWYAYDYYTVSPPFDPTGPEAGENRVARGGSWFCSPGYCGAYSSNFRGASPPDNTFNNVGFRCAADMEFEQNSHEGDGKR